VPEGPEVLVVADVIRKSIGKVFINSDIIENVPSIEHRFTRNGIDRFIELAQEWKIIDVQTYGKLITFEIETPYDKLVALNTLGMTGSWRYNAKNLKHTRLSFFLKDGGDLSFIDSRCLGFFKLVSIEDKNEYIKKIGWDLLNAPAPDELWMSFQKHPKTAKHQVGEALINQYLYAGLGNIYKSECLYDCKIHPQRIVAKLNSEEWLSINYSAHKILKRAYELGGSSIVDFEADGVKGKAHLEHKIYQKTLCPAGHEVSRITQKGRTTHFCSVCVN
jgi:formamidopyrimidine-DNA glycosylase